MGISRSLLLRRGSVGIVWTDSGKSVLLQRLGDWGVHWVSNTVLVATVTTLHWIPTEPQID